ncbi:serine hydrolase [Candidatus Bathyarchaeota archaeon]|nr:serine hydrolase [Candidatus Bathyarchaeota archaeon]
MSYLPQEQPFRGSFIYNNFAYEVLGHVIEKISGSSYSSFLHDRLLRPLGMERTYYTDAAGKRENEAKPYAALTDATPVQISPALKGDNVLMGPAGGIRSCVSDLLVFYNGLMDAAAGEMEVSTAPNPVHRDRPFLSQLSAMWTGWNILPMPLIREHSYGYGWLRAQLPSVLAPSRGDPELSPLVGVGAPSRLAIWHSGDIPGYQTHVTLFPETKQAVVVLTNSLSLNSGSRYINNLLIEALHDNLHNAPNYTRMAKITASLGASRMETVYEKLMNGKSRSGPSRALNAYVGRYFNAVQNFFIDVSLDEGDLYLSFMGRKKDTFKLETYGHDSLFWFLSHDEAARLARYDGYGDEFYILKFCCVSGDRDTIDTLWWKHEQSLSELGEAFERRAKDPEKAVQGAGFEL